MTITQRIAGSLVGLAVGDALGAPVEGWPRSAIARRYPEGIRDYVASSDSGLKPGRCTDDTELAVLVAGSLLASGDLDMTDIAGRLLAWADGGGVVGPSTAVGISALRRGVHWSEAGGADTPSSGCLPRCAPVALVMPPDRVVAATRDCCRPTHRHPAAMAASVALNLVLQRLADGMPWNAALAALDLPQFDCPAAPAVREAIARAGRTTGSGSEGALGVLGVAVHSVNRSPNAEAAIIAAVSAGGDTDTCGAVAGALAGARWGLDALPARWLDGCDAVTEALRLGRALVQLWHRHHPL